MKIVKTFGVVLQKITGDNFLKLFVINRLVASSVKHAKNLAYCKYSSYDYNIIAVRRQVDKEVKG